MKKILCALLVLLFMLTMLPEGTGGAMAVEPTIVKMVAGESHSFVLMSDGSLYGWGGNRYGQLGTYAPCSTPVKIGTGFTDVATMFHHTLALKGDSLYAWGENSAGQLGDGTKIERDLPVLIGTGYTAIAAGYSNSLALKGDALYMWGFMWGYLENGQYYGAAYGHLTTPVLIGTGYTAISAGAKHVLALKGDVLYAWGENYDGQVGDGTNETRYVPVEIGTGYTAIAAGPYRSHALKGNTLYSWGNNTTGALGDGTVIYRRTPVQIGTGFTAISAGRSFCLALKGNALYTWGRNVEGQLGDGSNNNRSSPMQIGTGFTSIAAGALHSLAVKGNALYVWGYNGYSQLGGVQNPTKNIPTRNVYIDGILNLTPINDTSVKVIPATATLYVGESLPLNAAVSPDNATNTDVTWSSSDNKIAIVTPEGVVIGIKGGMAAIIAKTESGKTAKCTVTVKEIKETSVKLDKSSIKIVVGESVTLNATVSPGNASFKNVTWSSGNKNIATVSSSGVVTGVKNGKATITAKTVNGKTAKCVVTVVPLPSKVTLNKSTMTIIAGKYFTLKATVVPSNANDRTITWTSSDETIATVCSQGKVTGMSIGSATIIAETINGKKASCTVTVNYAAATGVSLDKTSASLMVGDTLTLIPTVRPNNANPSVTWSSGDKTKATVSSTGVVTAIKKGIAIITVKTTNGKTAKCVVTVLSN